MTQTFQTNQMKYETKHIHINFCSSFEQQCIIRRGLATAVHFNSKVQELLQIASTNFYNQGPFQQKYVGQCGQKIYSLANFRQGTHLWLAERLERDCSVRHKLYNCHCKCFVGGFNPAPELIRLLMLMAIKQDNFELSGFPDFESS